MGWLELRFEHDSGWGILGYPALFSEGESWGILGYPGYPVLFWYALPPKGRGVRPSEMSTLLRRDIRIACSTAS